jgi:hypothetical protein
VDIAIKKNNKIIGFIEVDGEFHYGIDYEYFYYYYDYPCIRLVRKP